MTCDFRIASQSAELGQPEIKLGVFPTWGGTQRLPRIVGIAKAKELILTGSRITAQTAQQIQLVHMVVPKETLREETTALAHLLGSGPSIALKLAKHAMNFGTQVPLDIGLTLEAQAFGLVVSTRDAAEGISAFLQKREPKFHGR